MAVQTLIPQTYNSGISQRTPTTTWSQINQSFYYGKVIEGGIRSIYPFDKDTESLGYTIGSLTPGYALVDLHETVASTDYSGFINMKYSLSFNNFNNTYINITTNTNYIYPDRITLNIAASGGPTGFGGTYPVLSGEAKITTLKDEKIGSAYFMLRSGVHTHSLNVPIVSSNSGLLPVPQQFKLHISNIGPSGVQNISPGIQYNIYTFDIQTSGQALSDNTVPLTLFGELDLVKGYSIDWFDDESKFHYDPPRFPIPEPLHHDSYSLTNNRSGIFNQFYNFLESGNTTTSGTIMPSTNGSEFCLVTPNAVYAYDGILVNDTFNWWNGSNLLSGVNYLGRLDSLQAQRLSGIYSVSTNSSIQRPGIEGTIQGFGLFMGMKDVQDYIDFGRISWNERRITFNNALPASGDWTYYIKMAINSDYELETIHYDTINSGYSYGDVYFPIFNIPGIDFQIHTDKNNDYTTSGYYYNGILQVSNPYNFEFTRFIFPWSEGFPSNADGSEWGGTSKFKSFLIDYSGNTLSLYGIYNDSNEYRKFYSTTVSGLVNPSGIINIESQGNYNYTIFEIGTKSGLLSNAEKQHIENTICSPLNYISKNVSSYDSGVYAYINYPKNVTFNSGGYLIGQVAIFGGAPKFELDTNLMHYVTNKLSPIDRSVYQVIPSSDFLVKAVVEYTGTHPSGLYLCPEIVQDGNNVHTTWTNPGQFLFNSGITELVFSGIFQDTNPYPFSSGASYPLFMMKVITPGSINPVTTSWSGGQFRIYALEFESDILYAEPTGAVNTIPLHVKNSMEASGLPFFINSENVVGGLEMFTSGFGGNSLNDVDMTVWTTGSSSGEVFDTVTMYINSFLPSSGGIDLYITAPLSGTKEEIFPLTVWNTNSGSLATPFYIQNTFDSGNASTTLYVTSFSTDSGNLNLYINSTHSDLTTSGTINLYMLVETPEKSVPLFLRSVLLPISGGLNFYTKSSAEESGSVPFYIAGGGIDVRQNDTTLFISNFETNSGIVPLYILGNFVESTIPFHLESTEIPELASGLDFYINSDTELSIYKGLELNLQAEEVNGKLPFYISAPSSGESNGSINIFMLNDTTTSNSAFLYVESNISGIVNNATLYTAGFGEADGAFVERGSINLMIGRQYDSTANQVNLILNGPSGVVVPATLHISGGYLTNNSVYLNIPSTVGLQNSGISQYIHGF